MSVLGPPVAFVLAAVLAFVATPVSVALARETEQEMAALRQEHDRLAARLRRCRAYSVRRHRLAQDLAAGRRTLDEAVAELGALEAVRDPAWLRQFRRVFPGLSVGQILEADLRLPPWCPHCGGDLEVLRGERGPATPPRGGIPTAAPLAHPADVGAIPTLIFRSCRS